MTNSLREVSKNNRLDSVVRMCAKQPTTIKEIQDNLGIVYNTAWRYVDVLIKSGKIKPVLKLRNGVVAYVAGKQTVLPQIWNQYTNQHNGIMDYVAGYDPNNVTASELAAHRVPQYIMQLMRCVDLDDVETAVKIRVEILTAISLFTSTTSMCEQLIAEKRFYSEVGMKELKSDPEFNSSVITSSYDKFLRSLIETHNETETANVPEDSGDQDIA